ncbi:hypothetical protein [Thermus tengchongensis]|uniref:Uncharacterized protein n=1 Tax=Thermus tengchongensis TaxID=1214928 RepID=A0A4Y9FCP3_9DEIN|nr:hypothetical protein [Thermus tengchongensis]TFU26917.1 hypothetical protein E0687_04110 [Thermus tengchongensis]
MRRLPPLRPRFLYLVVRGPFPWPLPVLLPLFALEWTLLAVLFLLKTKALLRGRPLRGLPLKGVFALRGLPPLALVGIAAEEAEVKVGLW